MILTQSFKHKEVVLPYLHQQVQLFSYFLGCKYFVDSRSKQIQIFDKKPCKERRQYIHQNLKLMIKMAIAE